MSKHAAPYPGPVDDDQTPTTRLTALSGPTGPTGPAEPTGPGTGEHRDEQAGQGDAEPFVAVGSGRSVTCPECGAVATVAVNRRESHDFCATCDFPLFWTPSQVVLGDDDLRAQAALRRMPGTAGRTTVGSLACPHCSEANPISGVLCVRCGGDLHPVAAPAPPPPPPAPEPEPAPEPASGIAWWWWAIGAATLVLLALVVAVLVRG